MIYSAGSGNRLDFRSLFKRDHQMSETRAQMLGDVYVSHKCALKLIVAHQIVLKTTHKTSRSDWSVAHIRKHIRASPLTNKHTPSPFELDSVGRPSSLQESPALSPSPRFGVFAYPSPGRNKLVRFPAEFSSPFCDKARHERGCLPLHLVSHARARGRVGGQKGPRLQFNNQRSLTVDTSIPFSARYFE
eukprot:6693503-Pyramimonas_sp.AAC.1